MEVLNKQNRTLDVVKVAAFIFVVAVLSAAIAFFVRISIDMNKSAHIPVESAKRVKIGTILAVNGRVFVSGGSSLAEKKVEEGESIYTGDRIQTSSDGKAKIRISGGVVLQLGADSLMQMPVSMEGEGGALELKSGDLSISGDATSGAPALRTPQALINLKARNVVSFDTSDLDSVGPGYDVEKGGKMPFAYVGVMLESYERLAGDGRRDKAESIRKSILAAQGMCLEGKRNECMRRLDESWRYLNSSIAEEIKSAKVDISISVAGKGKESISVKSGAVKVEAGGRTLAVAKGDKLALASGSVPTMPSISESARASIMPEKPSAPAVIEQPVPEPQSRPVPEHREEIRLEIDSMSWQ